MAKDTSTSVVKHDKSTHEILYGDSDVDANLFDDLGDRVRDFVHVVLRSEQNVVVNAHARFFVRVFADG